MIFFLSYLVVPLVRSEDIYLAQFETLNGSINGVIAGSVTIWMNNKKITAFTRLFAGFPSATHMQNIYLGKRCPDSVDDLNQDGLIDITEGRNVWGDIIIPLDADISSQDAGENLFPRGDNYGNYVYERETYQTNLTNDLRRPDTRPEDNVVKLPSNEKLTFNGKVVVIQGIDADYPLPETIQTMGITSAQLSLPIACGILKKIK